MPPSCGVCNKAVGSKDGIQCEICDRWHHSKCVGISSEVYEFVSTSEQTHWFCQVCNAGVGNWLKDTKSLQEKVDIIEKLVEKHRDEGRKEMEKLFGKQKDEFHKELEKVTRDIKEI